MIAENNKEQVFLGASPEGCRRVMTRFLAMSPERRELNSIFGEKVKRNIVTMSRGKRFTAVETKTKMCRSTSKNVQVLPRLKRMLEDSS